MTDLSDCTAQISVNIQWQSSQDVDGLATPNSSSGRYGGNYSWTFGTALAKITNAFFDQVEITGGGSATVDLFSLIVPPSNLNISFGFVTVRGLAVELIDNEDDSVGASNISVGNSLTSPFNGWLLGGGSQQVDAGGVPYLAGGPNSAKTVSATQRNLLITNLDGINKATVRITVVGVEIGA